MLISEFIEKHKLLFTAKLVEFNATAPKEKVGPFKSEAWKHDAWEVTFTKENWMPAGALVTAYKTGTGHREKAGSALHSESPGLVVHTPKGPRFIEKGFRWKAVEPKAHEVLCCLASDARAVEQTFEEWCSDFGSDTDSIRARATYDTCRDTATKLLRMLGLEGLAELWSCEEG
jgi:hypothetical protein